MAVNINNNDQSCLKFLQWNCRGISKKKHIFEYFINTHQIDIFCIAETLLKPEHNFSISNFKTVSVERAITHIHRDGGGIALLINSKLKFKCIDNEHQDLINLCKNNFVEIQIVKIFTDANNFVTVINIYSPPRTAADFPFTEANFWQKFFDYINDFENVILVGDFNAKKDTWSIDLKENVEGKKLDAALISSNFMIINNGECTRSSTDESSKSTIDLTFMSPNLINGCMWEVLDFKYSSDHFPIKFSLNNKKPKMSPCRPKLVTKAVNWEEFKRKCLEKLDNFVLSNQESYKLLIDSITNSVLEAGGKVISEINNYSKTRPSWWNDECQKLIELDRQNYINLKNNYSLKNLNEYDKQRKKGKNRINNIWKDNYREFCGKINHNTNPAVVWRHINAIKNKKMNTSIPILSNKVDRAVVNRAFDKLAQDGDVDFRDKSHLLTINQPNISVNTDIFSQTITINEYFSALKSFRINSAPGPDLINFEILLNLPVEIHVKLCDYFQLILENGVIPDAWTEFFVIFIPKQNKNDVRPISLANCLLKHFEKIIQRKIEFWSEKNNIIPEQQSGFRKNRSCLDTVSTLVTEIKNNNVDKKMTGVIFLDIEGAYDNVDPYLLYRELWRFGLPYKTNRVIYELIKSRRICAYNEGEKIGVRTAVKGVPQGSVLSPILFNLYLSLLESCLPRDVKLLMYADDIAIYAEDNNLERLTQLLSQALGEVANFLDRKCLRLSVPKTKLIIFSNTDKRLNYLRLNTKIALYGREIELVDSIRYLGFTLKYNLSWDLHINQICQSSKKLLGVIKAVAGLKWGGHPQTLLNVYKGLIRSRLDWGSQLFDETSKSNLKKLDVIQYAGLRTAMGLMKTTPTNILLDMAGEPPLSMRRKYLTEKYILKIFSYNNNPLKSAICELSNNINYYTSRTKSNLVETKNRISDVIDNLITYDKPGIFNFSYNNRFVNMRDNISLSEGYVIAGENEKMITKKKKKGVINANFNKYLIETLPEYVPIYTDGSKNPEVDKVGFAVFCPDLDFRLKLRVNSVYSIFQAEAFAITRAINLVSDNQIKKSVIVTDSKSVLSALFSEDKKGNQDMVIYNIKLLYSMAVNDDLDIKFVWVPSHCGIEGNEVVDKLAGESLNLDSIFISGYYHYNVVCKLKENLKNDSIEILREQSNFKGKIYFNHKDKILDKPWFRSNKSDRKIICFISRIRSGHTCSAAHLTDKNIKNDRSCECGTPVQNLNHMFFECKKYYDQTSNLLVDIFEAYPEMTKDVVKLAFSNNWKVYNLLFNFAVKNNLLV